VAGLGEHGGEHSGSIKKARFFDKLGDISFSNNVLHHGVGML